MTDSTDVAIVGAGPYGLSLAAHLSAAGVPYRHFGVPMNLWRTAMPRGMYLKSQGFASNLSDAGQAMTLEAFCSATGRPYGSYGVPVPLDTFVAYGSWFQARLSLPVEESLVTSVTRDAEGFQVTVGDGERLSARAVVLAVGVEHFAHQPAPFAELPRALCGHSSAYTDLAGFKGKEVIVLDGPFAETKEQLLGFFIVECASLEQAIDTAKELGRASSTSGSYEIRPLRDLRPGTLRP